RRRCGTTATAGRAPRPRPTCPARAGPRPPARRTASPPSSGPGARASAGGCRRGCRGRTGRARSVRGRTSGRAGDGTRGASSDGSPGPGNGTSVPSTERNETLALRVGNNSLRPRKSDPPTFASPRNAEGATSCGFVAPEPGGTPRGPSAGIRTTEVGMHRTARRASGGAALLLAATLVLTACGPQSQGGGGDETTGTSTETDDGGSTELSIVPSVQIDIEGAEVEATEGGDPADPAGDGSAECAEGTAIAMAGALTGPNAALGLNILYGAQLAVDEFNAANPGCQVTIKEFDTEGDPQKATQVAPQIVGDASVLGLLGPAFSGETAATGDVFSQAGLLSLSASATNPDLTKNGWTNFFRGLANDAVQGPSVAKYLVNTKSFGSVCVVSDNSDYGIGLAQQITEGLGDAANDECAAEV